MSDFVILMFEDEQAWSNLAAAEQERLLEGYVDWVDELRAQGRFKGGAPCGAGGRVLRERGGEVVEEAYDAARGVLTGFFVIDAPDLEAAVRIARGCPALTHGETVVVRPVGH